MDMGINKAAAESISEEIESKFSNDRHNGNRNADNQERKQNG